MEEKTKIINETFEGTFSDFKQANRGSDPLFSELYYLRAAQNIGL